MDLYSRIVSVYGLEDNDFINEFTDNQTRIVALYSLYHYYNADTTKLDDINSSFCNMKDGIYKLQSIMPSCTMDSDAVDFIFSLSEMVYNNHFIKDINNYLRNCAKIIADIIVKNRNNNETAIEIYDSLNIKLSDNNSYILKFICCLKIPMEDKFNIQQYVSEFNVKNDNFLFEIIFEDDIEELINDIESPKEYVARGFLSLINPDSICFFGEEKSFITTITASSLKSNYIRNYSNGLLASNLRYFVKSSKIDPKIINTIKNEPESFCYYNNGIIITCDDYRINGSTLELVNFSIVNGGQTTNLIGRTPLVQDFPVICKVIKNKFDDIEKRVEFLSKVAEASNTQKPINAKDLIANRKEQRMLKLQYASAGIFLKVKRGEKIDTTKYKEKWQNASNDEVAQMIYSIVYQNPGISKNSKSKLLDTERIYQIIFANSYSNDFLVSMQHIKIGFNEYQKHIKKLEPKTSMKFGLVKHANFLTFAVLGLIYKVLVNKELKSTLFSVNINNIVNTNTDLKLAIQQNDIGNCKLLSPNIYSILSKRTFFSLYTLILEDVLIPSYQLFKSNYYTYSYAHFCRSDTYYYNYVIPTIVKDMKVNYEKYLNICERIFDLSSEVSLLKTQYIDNNSNIKTLEEELIDYRKKVYHDSNRTIAAYKVFTNKQLASIMRYLPKTKEDLSKLGKLNKEQIDQFGDEIIRIIKKHTNVESMI